MNAFSSCSQAYREQKGESGVRCRGLDESGFSHGGLRGLVRGPDIGKAASYGCWPLALGLPNLSRTIPCHPTPSM